MNKTGIMKINDKEYEFKEGETILRVARRNKIPIPVLCYLKDITEASSCRICLVEVEGVPVPVSSCSMLASEGMSVTTESEQLLKHRRNALEMILLKHPLECEICENDGDCTLQNLAKYLGVSEVKNVTKKKENTLIDWNMMWFNSSLCVVCQRCTMICSDVAGCSAIEMADRASNVHIAPVDDVLDCDFCGMCADVCPVGAIIEKPFRYDVKIGNLEHVYTTCSFCPVGCRLNYGINNGIVHRVKSSGNDYTCSKGRYGFKFLDNEKRLVSPKIKIDGKFKKTTWQEAISAAKEGLSKHGIENSLVVIGSRLTNEEILNYKRLALKTGMRFITEAQILLDKFMSHYYEKFGRYESIGTIKDIPKSDLIFVVGTDFARESVGIKWHVLKGAVKNNAKVITIGLQRYDYDDKTYASIIADYANFAGEFEKIKSSDNRMYSSIREAINNAEKVSIIVGNEYISGEEQLPSVLAFADYIGQDKLNVFMTSNDKANFIGALYAGGEKIEDVIANPPKAVLALAVNPGKGKLEEIANVIDNAEFYVTPEIFVTGIVEKADVVLPSQALLEIEGTYTSIDGRLLKLVRVSSPQVNIKSNIEVASLIAEAFKKKLSADNYEIFAKNAEDMGYNSDDINSDEAVYRKSELTFNKTNYEYVKPDTDKHKTVYVSARHHEGVLTMIESIDLEDTTPTLPNVEVIVKPGKERSSIDSENIAKGISLVPKSTSLEGVGG